MTSTEQEKYDRKVGMIRLIVGCCLLTFLLVVDTFYKEVDKIIYMIPALMIGLDINKILKR